jgi:hypothetical protein
MAPLSTSGKGPDSTSVSAFISIVDLLLFNQGQALPAREKEGGDMGSSSSSPGSNKER